ncbi:zinc finger protein 180-like isoform X2 [Condylostylus longicornis]|uniref:zinc finger protein 180-like isoform X2 n=1 Tax=Condylostylus longicornis TaxID=2530218 RepID=UPI00244DBB81|nr:zinc finger protein 180-like isoform X2 [Condylostylus longicornis]
MSSSWNDESTNILLKHLQGKDHIYNRNHPDYKTYNVIRECADLGKLFNPPKTGKDVLDKITSIRNNLIQMRQSIEKYNTSFNFPLNFQKYYFMYVSLFGELPENLYKIVKENFLNEKKEIKKLILDISQEDYMKTKIDNLFIDEFDLNLKGNEFQTGKEFGNVVKMEKDCDMPEIVEIDNENFHLKGEMLPTIINFISDKPFLWDSGHPSFSDTATKKQILENFAASLTPPVAVNLIQNRILYLRSKFFKALKTNNKNKWHLFKDCKFFLKSKNETHKYLSDEEDIKNDSILYKIIQFIKNKPYFYSRKDPKYYDSDFKNNILIDFGKTFSPPFSIRSLKKRITYLRLKFFKFLKDPNKNSSWKWFNDCEFFLSEHKKKFGNTNHKKEIKEKSAKETDPLELLSISETIHETHSGKELFMGKKSDKNVFTKEESFVNNSEKPVNEIGIQCDLYKEIFEEKIKNTMLKNCSCFEEFMKIIENFNPIDKNFEIREDIGLLNENVPLELDRDCTEMEQDELPIFDEEPTITPEVEEYSTDSSDYGLTEIPFPEKPKTSTKKTVDKYKCDQCPKKFNTHKLLDKHFTLFHAQRSLLCSKCGKLNASFRLMQMHENVCNPDENKFCYECKQVFKSKLIYYDHFNLVHDRKNPYKCCCGRSFQKYTKIVLHLNAFHCGSLDSCTLPDYISKEFLETFIESKSNDNTCENVNDDKVERKLKFWCIMCKTNSYNNRAYMAHFDREFHLNAEKLWLEEFNIEGPFECEICDRNMSVFGKISELVKHRHKYHHKCTLASYFEKFEYSDDGEEVLITEPTDYSKINSLCHICKYFFFMGDFQKHFESFEHTNLEKKWLEKLDLSSFECCSIEYKNLLEFLVHKHSKHGEWPINRLLKHIEGKTDEVIPEYLNDRINSKLIYKCSICNYYSCYKVNFVFHMLHHIPEKYIECSCGEKFITRVKLLVHQKRNGCSRNGCKIPRFVLHIDFVVNRNLV